MELLPRDEGFLEAMHTYVHSWECLWGILFCCFVVWQVLVIMSATFLACKIVVRCAPQTTSTHVTLTGNCNIGVITTNTSSVEDADK